MKTILAVSLTFALAAPGAAAAQTAEAACPVHRDHTSAQAPAAPVAETPQAHQHAASRYAGHEGSEIKALTADEIRAYREGTGMGLAKPAELNHYPGPRHVLDLAADLGLSENQKTELQAVFDRMHHSAIELGAEIVAREKALDQAFAAGSIDESKLRDSVGQLAALQGQLRAARPGRTPRDPAHPEAGAGRALRRPARLHDPAERTLLTRRSQGSEAPGIASLIFLS